MYVGHLCVIPCLVFFIEYVLRGSVGGRCLDEGNTLDKNHIGITFYSLGTRLVCLCVCVRNMLFS